jgi:hypothetical protein
MNVKWSVLLLGSVVLFGCTPPSVDEDADTSQGAIETEAPPSPLPWCFKLTVPTRARAFERYTVDSPQGRIDEFVPKEPDIMLPVGTIVDTNAPSLNWRARNTWGVDESQIKMVEISLRDVPQNVRPNINTSAPHVMEKSALKTNTKNVYHKDCENSR